jgi:hypothetical protein
MPSVRCRRPVSATRSIRQDLGIPTMRSFGESSAPLLRGSDSSDLNRVRQAELTSVAWVASRELSYDEWLRHGRRLGVVGRSAAWWIGDWVRYGAGRYGRKYELATRVTGYERQTLLNMVYVSTRFEISRRRENLSWSHHAELAALGVEEQERWLDCATSQRLTVRRLRRELIVARESLDTLAQKRAAAISRQAETSAPEPIPDPEPVMQRKDLSSDNALPGRELTCPRCGHHFTRSSRAPDFATSYESSGSPSPPSDS